MRLVVVSNEVIRRRKEELFPSFSGALPDHNNRPFNPDFTPDL
jgi:hypothetical protein